MRQSLLLILGIILCCSGCAQQSEDWIIKDKAMFDLYSSKPLYDKYGQVTSVKVVFDNMDQKLHFISSQAFEYHYEFCMNRLNYPFELDRFNIEEYSGDETRRFLIANVNYYQSQNLFALELGPSDRMNKDQLQKLFESVKASSYFGDDLRLMLNTVHVTEISQHLNDVLFVTPNDIYQGQRYQPISKLKGEGRFIVITNWEQQKNHVKPYDVILVKDIPTVFPLVAGVIVTEFQTPLSHVSLLGQNRKIPICAYTRAFETKSIQDLNGLTVSFEVTQDTFLLVQNKVDLTKLLKPGKEIHLKKDLSIDSIIPITYIRERHSNVVGNKAANFGELASWSQTIGFKTPENAFAIPFFFYNKHIQSAKVKPMIASLANKENLNRTREEVEYDLNLIRHLIETTELDANFLIEVKNMILRNPKYTRMRFRSSTNAEDAVSFSGAGLYTSKTGDINDPNKPIDIAIKKVWSSLWTYEAFMERVSVNMSQDNVAMGILVHRSFPDEEVNGVAITTNIYRKNYLGFVVNAQLGDESVVQPKTGVQCDQFICYPDESTTIYGKAEGGIDIISYSSLNNGQLVMTKAEIQHLANVLELLKRRYVRNHYLRTTYFNFGLDIEFKLDGKTRELYIKQIRPYNR